MDRRITGALLCAIVVLTSATPQVQRSPQSLHAGELLGETREHGVGWGLGETGDGGRGAPIGAGERIHDGSE